MRWIALIVLTQENDHWREAWVGKPKDCWVAQRAPEITFWKHSLICQTYLSNWSPFRGEIPRSDGLIWERNWLRSIPGTIFGNFSKISKFLTIPCQNMLQICSDVFSKISKSLKICHIILQIVLWKHFRKIISFWCAIKKFCPLRKSWISLVSCPTIRSLSLVFGFLWWSSILYYDIYTTYISQPDI